MLQNRIFRAKVVSEGPATCLYVSRDKFFEFMKNNDIETYMKKCESYTNFGLEGANLVTDINGIKKRSTSLLKASGLDFNRSIQ